MKKKPNLWYMLLIVFATIIAACGSTDEGVTPDIRSASALVDNVSASVSDQHEGLSEAQIVELVESIVDESQQAQLTEEDVEEIALRVFDENIDRILAGEEFDFDILCECLQSADDNDVEEAEEADEATEEDTESIAMEESITTTTEVTSQVDSATETPASTTAPATTAAAPATTAASATTEAPATTEAAAPTTAAPATTATPATTEAPATTAAPAPAPSCSISINGDPTRANSTFTVSTNFTIGNGYAWTVWSPSDPARNLERGGLGTSSIDWAPASSHAGQTVVFGFGSYNASSGLIDTLCTTSVSVPVAQSVQPVQTTTTTTAPPPPPPAPANDCVVTPSSRVIDVGESIWVTASNGDANQRWIVFDNLESDHSTLEGQTGRTIDWTAWANEGATSSGRTITFVAVGCRNAPNNDAFATVQVR